MKHNKSQPLKWLWKNTKKHTLKLAILTILGCLMAVISIICALVSKDLIDAATGVNDKSFINEILKIIVFLMLQLAIQSTIAFIYNMTVGKIKISLKTDLFGKLLNKDWLSVNKYHTGELSNRLNSDINLISDSITDIIPSFLSLSTSIVLGIYTLFRLEPFFGLICLAIGPIIVFAARFYRNKFKYLHKQFQETDGKTRSFMLDCLKNTLVIKSFQNETKMLAHLVKLQITNYKTSVKRNNVSIMANILFYISVTAGYYFAIAWGAYRISIGAISVGTLIAMLNLIGDAVTPFKTVSSLLPKFYQTVASVERIIELENLPNEQSKNNEKIKKNSFNYINIEGINYSYNENTKILDDFSLKINKGDFIAINGRSGIGKSTLLKLLLGILDPQKGKIFANVDNKEYEISKSTRQLFSYVPQGNMILAGTIKENIIFTSDDVDEQKLIKSAKIADIYDVISNLSDGFDTKLGEDGAGLSEGQIQRLAIARAIYHDSEILLFDEATSSLDKDTEMRILTNIKALDDKTLVIVSHRKEVLNFCSLIVNISVDKS